MMAAAEEVVRASPSLANRSLVAAPTSRSIASPRHQSVNVDNRNGHHHHHHHNNDDDGDDGDHDNGNNYDDDSSDGTGNRGTAFRRVHSDSRHRNQIVRHDEQEREATVERTSTMEHPRHVEEDKAMRPPSPLQADIDRREKQHELAVSRQRAIELEQSRAASRASFEASQQAIAEGRPYGRGGAEAVVEEHGRQTSYFEATQRAIAEQQFSAAEMRPRHHRGSSPPAQQQQQQQQHQQQQQQLNTSTPRHAVVESHRADGAADVPFSAGSRIAHRGRSVSPSRSPFPTARALKVDAMHSASAASAASSAAPDPRYQRAGPFADHPRAVSRSPPPTRSRSRSPSPQLRSISAADRSARNARLRASPLNTRGGRTLPEHEALANGSAHVVRSYNPDIVLLESGPLSPIAATHAVVSTPGGSVIAGGDKRGGGRGDGDGAHGHHSDVRAARGSSHHNRSSRPGSPNLGADHSAARALQSDSSLSESGVGRMRGDVVENDGDYNDDGPQRPGLRTSSQIASSTAHQQHYQHQHHQEHYQHQHHQQHDSSYHLDQSSQWNHYQEQQQQQKQQQQQLYQQQTLDGTRSHRTSQLGGTIELSPLQRRLEPLPPLHNKSGVSFAENTKSGRSRSPSPSPRAGGVVTKSPAAASKKPATKYSPPLVHRLARFTATLTSLQLLVPLLIIDAGWPEYLSRTLLPWFNMLFLVFDPIPGAGQL
jgi:hypothetical protein